jgi:single-strand selective monofunctional uracil DNA glycosylase
VTIAQQVRTAADRLRREVAPLRFGAPVTHVYNPLDYARASHDRYIALYGATRKRVIFLGMNPGPFGMAQTGVPFGEVAAVREWMKIFATIRKPNPEHPKRPVTGFDCHRSEVSGRRLWGLFADRFGEAANFFRDHFVVNYCPLVFMEESGRNLTPDNLRAPWRDRLQSVCDEHLRAVIAVLQPEWLIGVGDFAEKRARQVFADASFRLGKIAHPSPASPAANRDWAGLVTGQLEALGVWPGGKAGGGIPFQ